MAAHVHAALMAEYAIDATKTEEPWKLWEQTPNEAYFPGRNLDYTVCQDHIGWHPEWIYRRIPKTININGFEVPEPVRHDPHYGQIYFTPSFGRFIDDLAVKSVWSNDECDKRRLNLGLIHLEIESAELHCKAALSFTSTTNTVHQPPNPVP